MCVEVGGGVCVSVSVSVCLSVCLSDRLVGLVVKASVSGAEGSGFKSRLLRDFSGSSHTSDLKIGAPVATLPGVWHYRVDAGIVGPVSIYCDWVR